MLSKRLIKKASYIEHYQKSVNAETTEQILTELSSPYLDHHSCLALFYKLHSNKYNIHSADFLNTLLDNNIAFMLKGEELDRMMRIIGDVALYAIENNPDVSTLKCLDNNFYLIESSIPNLHSPQSGYQEIKSLIDEWNYIPQSPEFISYINRGDNLEKSRAGVLKIKNKKDIINALQNEQLNAYLAGALFIKLENMSIDNLIEGLVALRNNPYLNSGYENNDLKSSANITLCKILSEVETQTQIETVEKEFGDMVGEPDFLAEAMEYGGRFSSCNANFFSVCAKLKFVPTNPSMKKFLKDTYEEHKEELKKFNNYFVSIIK